MMHLKLLYRTSRPRFWIYIIGPLLIALAAAGQAPTAGVYVLLLYATLPANLLIYGVNDIFDQETDRFNKKKGSYEVLLNQRSVKLISYAIVGLQAPLLAALIVLLPVGSLAWLGLFLLTGIGYSMPPIRAKARPFIDAAFNILYAALGFAAYRVLSGQQPPLVVVLASLFWCMAMHAYSAVPDITADKQAHTPTIATIMGAKPTIILCGLFYGVAGGLMYEYLGWFSLIAAAIYIMLMIRSYQAVASQDLFKWYARFPLINSVLGMVMFFVVAGNKFIR